MLDKFIAWVLKIFPKPIREFYYRHESVLLYLIVGAMTTAVSLITQYVPLWLGFPTEVNTTVSWVCSVTFAFFTNKVWVFKDEARGKSDWARQAAAFYGGRLTTYFLEMAFMSGTVRMLHQNEYIMKLIAQVFILVINYLFSKLVVFRKRRKKNQGKDVSDGV
ncbi:MAG: GtrA family protein [Ruminococcus sp.]|nr:GtrA family protein [Ruminococcus sp.]MCM1381984.1 GtrA family protein [Muribaculaceae bacterium]MCM1478401.1 GtrA family protein [Muribaculaceae bacterium]